MTAEQYLRISVELWGCFFCIMAAVAVFITRRSDPKGARRLIRVMLCCIILMSSEILLVFATEMKECDYIILRILHFSSNFVGMLIIPLVANYISHIICVRSEGTRIYWSTVEWGVFFLGIILLSINEFIPYIYYIGEDGKYIELAFFFLPVAVIFIGLLMALSVVIVYIRYLANIEKVAIVSFLLLPMMSMIMLIYDEGKYYINIAIVISAMIMFFAYEINYSDYMVKLEKNLNDDKLRIINQQMQPHFIFNSLALIRYLCRTNPQEAIKSIDDFSVCMRKTTDFMGYNLCTDVANEIDFVKHYLNIQKKRFNEKIDIKFLINDVDFSIPPFSIQTLTENALHHGLQDGQVEDARIVIETKKIDGNHIVIISDNGVGFNVDEAKNDKFKNDEAGHVGISNTRKRIEIMCNGQLFIESKPNTGTSIKIIIPE